MPAWQFERLRGKNKQTIPQTTLSTRDTFQDPEWMHGPSDSAETYTHYVFFLYIHTYDKL